MYNVCLEFHKELEFSHNSAMLYFWVFVNRLTWIWGYKTIRGWKIFDTSNPDEFDGVNLHAAFFNVIRCINGNIFINLNPSIKFF